MRKFITFAAILSTFAIAPAAIAQCSLSGWCFVRETSEGADYLKVLSRDAQYVQVIERSISKDGKQIQQFKITYDCNAGRWRFSDGQRWLDVYPKTQGETDFNLVCK